MPENDPFGPPLAAKLYLTAHHWLAEYLVKKFRQSALENPSLPRDLVDEAILQSRDNPSDMWCLALAHVFDAEQYALASYVLAPVGSATALLKRQPPPTTTDLALLVYLDPTNDAAECAVKYAPYSRFFEMSKKLQRRVLKKVDATTRRSWNKYGYHGGFEGFYPEALQPLATETFRKRWFKQCLVRSVLSLDSFGCSPVRSFVDTLHTHSALNVKFAEYLTQGLGENEKAWDAFFALGASWHGNFAELLTTAQNLG